MKELSKEQKKTPPVVKSYIKSYAALKSMARNKMANATNEPSLQLEEWRETRKKAVNVGKLNTI